MIKNDRGVPFNVTATAAGNATATQTGVANQTIYVTDISGSSDKAGATVQVKDGTTVIWQTQIMQTAAGSSWYGFNFLTPLKLTIGNSLNVVTTGTGYADANASGFIINNT